jgi:hypothetical protein
MFFVFNRTFKLPYYHPGGPYYYKTWASYSIPYRPIDEISFANAKKLEKEGYAYYEAYFNNDGMIIKFIKHVKGTIAYQDEYIYENKKLKKRISKGDDYGKGITNIEIRGELKYFIIKRKFYNDDLVGEEKWYWENGEKKVDKWEKGQE